jgi:hypothetical protein
MRRRPRRAEVDPTAPSAWGTSDRSGFIGNHSDMQWQYEWRGFDLINQNILVHEDELDEPQRQLGSIIIPPDPPSILNARPERYSIEETPVSIRVTMDGELRITQLAGANYSLRNINAAGDLPAENDGI